MRRKGFTLIELLAVIVILAVIGLITIPMIGNIIEDSRKEALESSVQGIVEAARYFTLSNDGTYKFIFNDTVQGKTEEGDYALDYKGNVDAEGELYIDNDGNISLCLMNEDYYVYKNYNSGIYIGNVNDDTCIVDYDAITNKYIAMLDDGTGQVSNVYSKEQVDSLVTNLQEQIISNNNDIELLNTLVSDNTSNITTLQNNLSNYALKSDVENLSTTLSSDIANVESSFNEFNATKTYVKGEDYTFDESLFAGYQGMRITKSGNMVHMRIFGALNEYVEDATYTMGTLLNKELIPPLDSYLIAQMRSGSNTQGSCAVSITTTGTINIIPLQSDSNWLYVDVYYGLF